MERIALSCRALAFQGAEEFVTRRDMEEAEPGAQTLPCDRPQRLLVSKIPYMDAAVRAHARGGRRQRTPPVGDHREAVGEDRVVERLIEPEEPWRHVLGIAVPESDRPRHLGARDGLFR